LQIGDLLLVGSARTLTAARSGGAGCKFNIQGGAAGVRWGDEKNALVYIYSANMNLLGRGRDVTVAVESN